MWVKMKSVIVDYFDALNIASYKDDDIEDTTSSIAFLGNIFDIYQFEILVFRWNFYFSKITSMMKTVVANLFDTRWQRHMFDAAAC